MKLRGKTALVTGGNRGIGLEVCRQLGREGCRVVLGSRDPKRGESAAAELLQDQLDVTTIQLDVASGESIASAMGRLRREVDILINNAAILDHGSIQKLEPKEIDYIIHTNLIGAMLLARELCGGMRDRGWGRIVNVSSGMGSLHRGLGSDSVCYRVTKLALNGFTICLAQELKGTGVLVNSVDPGWVRTEMGGSMAHKTPAEGARGIVAAVLLPDRGPSGVFFRDGKRVEW